MYWFPEGPLKFPCRSRTLGPLGVLQGTSPGRRMPAGLLVHQEYHSLLDKEKNQTDEEWFEEVGELVFTFKHQVHNWLRDAEMECANACRESSRKGSKSCSSGSSNRTKISSSGSNLSRSSKERVLWKKN